MTIAGAVVVPVRPELTDIVKNRLEQLPEVEVQGSGPKGIAVVLEAAGTDELRRVSEAIESWEEVLGFELASLNWESET